MPLIVVVLAPLFCWYLAGFAAPTTTAYAALGGFASLALLLYHAPASRVHGALTPSGAVPTYPDNAMTHLVAVVLLFLLGDAREWWRASLFVDELHHMILPLNAAAFVLCLVLLLTGLRYGLPPDDGPSGKGLVHDFYAGVWLHPRVGGVDLKLYINSRVSMTLWFLHSLSAALVTDDVGVRACAVSQLLYLLTFFVQEPHYVHTIDIIEDRAGFYETWGCLVWVPAVYTYHTCVGLHWGSALSPLAASLVFSAGLAGWVCNVWSNEQRRRFRAAPDAPLLGECGGGAPDHLVVEYMTADDLSRRSTLLVAGWWGRMRHPQYVFDLLQAYSWGVLAGGLTTAPSALLYPVYLTVLLVHRCLRDERRCTAKYGDGYRAYCERVPYRMLPYCW